MSAFDGIVDASFKNGDNGDLLFFPWGILGPGYIVPNDRRKQQIRAFLRTYTLIALTIVVFVGLAAMAFMMYGSWWVGVALWLGLLVAALIGGVWTSAILTKGLDRSPQRLTFREGHRNAARSIRWTQLWLLEGLSIAMTALSVIAIVKFLSDGHSPWFYGSTGAIGVLLFTACAVFFGLILYAKSRMPAARAKRGKSLRHARS